MNGAVSENNPNYFKTYKVSFIITACVTFICLIFGFATGFFTVMGVDGVLENTVTSYYDFPFDFNSDFIANLKEFCLLYFFDFKYLFFFYIFGLSVASPPFSTLLCILKGSLFGYSAFCFSLMLSYEFNGVKNPLLSFSLFIFISLLLVIIYAVACAKSVTFSTVLKYMSRTPKTFIKSKLFVSYTMTFLILSFFLALTITVKYLLIYTLL